MAGNPGYVESVTVLGCSKHPELLWRVALGQVSGHMLRLNLGSVFVTSFTPALGNRDQTKPILA